jgi:aminoglycoside 6-adenylyltransferase
MLERTYSETDYAATWEALYTMCKLFRITATHVAEHFGFEYPNGDDEKVSAYLQDVRFLPKNAQEIY